MTQVRANLPRNPFHLECIVTFTIPDSLTLKALSHIILDVTYMDPKNKSMLDTLETKEEVFKTFFTNKNILERLRGGKCSLVLF